MAKTKPMTDTNPADDMNGADTDPADDTSHTGAIPNMQTKMRHQLGKPNC